ncbi:E3 ubiquitin-protein ligase RNF186-like [Spea bombifrons]|uniref:E3 ubiquitin-protein ligase RNF186-like n=1 Tax=Spea bombifrons TaxID=233779 RepID=UPI00234AF1E7|nr:E3 ubiquitin-protein ligase RNF186-like [Spea bombifrons]
MATETSDAVEPDAFLPSLTECPICYAFYDNVFKTPLRLPCSHTFCMECLSRLCLFLKQSQNFPCPLCRTSAQIPPGGVPKMQPNVDIVSRFPPAMQKLQEVWVDGHKLCWMKADDPEIGNGSLVTLHLLPGGAGGQDSSVSVPQSLCRSFCRSIWGLGLSVLTVGLLVFTIVFIPVYVNSQ